jgi:hypothetical protein
MKRRPGCIHIQENRETKSDQEFNAWAWNENHWL